MSTLPHPADRTPDRRPADGPPRCPRHRRRAARRDRRREHLPGLAAGVGCGRHVVRSGHPPDSPGQSLTDADVRFEALDLPAGLAAAAFSDASASRAGRAGADRRRRAGAARSSDPGQASPGAELSFSIARDRAVDGRLRSGDLVDVFVTDDAGTTAVAEGVQVVDATARDDGSFGPTGELTVTLTVADPPCGAAHPGGARGRGHAGSQHPHVRRWRLMAADRYVVLGLARARRLVRRGRALGHGAALPVDFVKAVSGEEVHARLSSGRPFSALLVDGGLVALDRDLVQLAGRYGCAVVAVDDGRSARSCATSASRPCCPPTWSAGAARRPARRGAAIAATTTFRLRWTRPSRRPPAGGAGPSP